MLRPLPPLLVPGRLLDSILRPKSLRVPAAAAAAAATQKATPSAFSSLFPFSGDSHLQDLASLPVFPCVPVDSRRYPRLDAETSKIAHDTGLLPLFSFDALRAKGPVADPFAISSQPTDFESEDALVRVKCAFAEKAMMAALRWFMKVSLSAQASSSGLLSPQAATKDLGRFMLELLHQEVAKPAPSRWGNPVDSETISKTESPDFGVDTDLFAPLSYHELVPSRDVRLMLATKVLRPTLVAMGFYLARDRPPFRINFEDSDETMITLDDLQVYLRLMLLHHHHRMLIASGREPTGKRVGIDYSPCYRRGCRCMTTWSALQTNIDLDAIFNRHAARRQATAALSRNRAGRHHPYLKTAVAVTPRNPNHN
jgi:hypothetical protein